MRFCFMRPQCISLSRLFIVVIVIAIVCACKDTYSTVSIAAIPRVFVSAGDYEVLVELSNGTIVNGFDLSIFAGSVDGKASRMVRLRHTDDLGGKLMANMLYTAKEDEFILAMSSDECFVDSGLTSALGVEAAQIFERTQASGQPNHAIEVNESKKVLQIIVDERHIIGLTNDLNVPIARLHFDYHLVGTTDGWVPPNIPRRRFLDLAPQQTVWSMIPIQKPQKLHAEVYINNPSVFISVNVAGELNENNIDRQVELPLADLSHLIGIKSILEMK